MNDTQLLDRLAGTDAFTADVPVPDEIWTPDVALHEIERRTGMQTRERPIETPPREPSERPGWLVPALAGAAAIILAIVVGALLLAGGGDDPDVIEQTPTTTLEPAALTPLDVGEALNQASVAGDWEAVRRLYAEDATFSIDVGDIPDSSIISDAPLAVPFPLGRPLAVPFPILNQFDWDDDGVISGFDDIAATTMTLWALGVEPYRSCLEVDARTLVCDESGQGPFSTPPDLPIYSEIFTVVDGRIAQHTLDLSAEESFSPVGFVVPPRPVEYQDWVRENRAELNPDGALFEFLGKLLITPDTVEVHRQLIAEWVAQVSEPAAVTPAVVLTRLSVASGNGDWAALVALFAENATVTLGPGFGDDQGLSFPRSDPDPEGLFFHSFDWDGDSVLSGFDLIAADNMAAYAMGLDFWAGCSESSPSTIECFSLFPGHPFPVADRGFVRVVHSIEDGRITDSTWDITALNSGLAVDLEAASEYQEWVTVNRPEFNADGALFRFNPGELMISPDTVERHRQLIAEWRAQR